MPTLTRLAPVMIVVAALLALLPATGCNRPPPAPSSPNVLLIVVDTLRADRLGCYGSTLGATPSLDALAAESVRFTRAYSHAPWTLPAFASLFTAQPPPQHGAGGQLGQFRTLAPTARTVAECFRDAGYATAEIINVDFLTEPFGMTQGFTHVDFKTFPDNTQVRDAAATTDAAAAWLRSPREKPFFLLVHYFDPHLVYNPPAEFRRRFAAPQDREDRSWVFGTRDEIVAYHRGDVKLDDATIRRAEQLHNGAVAFTDSQIGRLLSMLRDLKLADTTIVAMTADHGEEFLDHGRFEHGHTLYHELLHVPLMIRFLSRLRPAVIDAPVGLVDVAPTLCALAGVTPGPHFGGRSLLDLIAGTDTAAHPLLYEGNLWGPPIRAWLDGDDKLIVQYDGPRLFNLRTDPGEKNDLAPSDPARLNALVADMQLVYRALAADIRAPADQPSLSEQQLERLHSLGYVP